MSVSGDFSSVLLLLFLLLFFIIFIRKPSMAYVIYEVNGESRTVGTREIVVISLCLDCGYYTFNIYTISDGYLI